MHSRLAAVLLVCLLLTGTACSGHGDEAAEPSGKAAKGSSSATPTAEEAAPVMLGPNRYVNACQVLPPATVQRVFRPGPQSGFSTEFVEKSLTAAQAAKEGETLGGTADSRCTYDLHRKKRTLLSVNVRHLPSARRARKQWKQIELWGSGKLSRQHLKAPRNELWQSTMGSIRTLEADGGIHLPGVPQQVLFRKETQMFVAQVGHVLIEVDHNLIGGAQVPAGPRAQQARLLGAAFKDILVNAANADLPQQSPDSWGGDYQPVLDPCLLLDEALHRSLFKGKSPYVRKTSLDLDPTVSRPEATTPYAQAPKVRCQRKTYSPGRGLGRSSTTRLELLHQPAGSDPEKFLEDSVQRMLFGLDAPTRYSLDQIQRSNLANHLFLENADFAMVLADSTGPVKERNAFGVMSLGPFIVEIRGHRPDPAGKDLFCCDLTVAQITTILETVSENLARVAEEQGIDVS